jgi:hypothetical protein
VNSPVNVPADTPKPVVNEFIWTLFSVYVTLAEAVPVRAFATTSADAIISLCILAAPKPIQERTPQPTISMSFELSQPDHRAGAVSTNKSPNRYHYVLTILTTSSGSQGSALFGAKLLERGKKPRSLGTQPA